MAMVEYHPEGSTLRADASMLDASRFRLLHRDLGNNGLTNPERQLQYVENSLHAKGWLHFPSYDTTKYLSDKLLLAECLDAIARHQKRDSSAKTLSQLFNTKANSAACL